MAIRLNGSTSGYIEIDAPAVAGTTAITLPATSGGNFVVTDSAGDLNIDSGTFFVDASTNRVGVGTTSPSQLLELNSTNASGGVGLNITNQGDGGTTTTPYAFINARLNSIRNGGEIRFGRQANYGSAANADSYMAFYTAADDVNNERLRIDSSGRVGIGTTSPSETLHVAGDMRVGTGSGSGNTIHFSRSGQTDAARIACDASSNLAFHTNAGERMRIDSSGRVGIGTSSPAAPLDLHKGSTGDLLRFGFDGTTYADFAYASNTFTLAANNSKSLAFETGSSERLRIDSSGRVGIGTTSPAANLHIVGTAGTGDFANGQLLRLDGGTISAADTGVGLAFTRTGSQLAFIQARRENASDEAGYLAFATQTSAGSHPERFRIDSSGRLLVGTSSATNNLRLDQKLAVVSTGASNLGGAAFVSYAGTSTDVGSFVDLSRSRGTADGSFTSVSNGDTLGWLIFRGTDGSQFLNAAFIKGVVDGSPSAGNMPGRIEFYTGTSSPTERMRIDSVGRFFTDSAAISSAGSITGTAQGGIRSIQASAIGNTRFECFNTTTTQAFAIGFSNANGWVGSISTSGSATAFNTSSDYRLKENVVDLDGAIDRVKQLAPKRFNFIEDPAKTVDGFIAHEAQTVVPEAVTGTHDEVDDDGNAVMQGIDQSKLVPLLTAALQEAIAKIETLEAKVAALEAN